MDCEGGKDIFYCVAAIFMGLAVFLTTPAILLFISLFYFFTPNYRPETISAYNSVVDTWDNEKREDFLAFASKFSTDEKGLLVDSQCETSYNPYGFSVKSHYSDNPSPKAYNASCFWENHNYGKQNFDEESTLTFSAKLNGIGEYKSIVLPIFKTSSTYVGGKYSKNNCERMGGTYNYWALISDNCFFWEYLQRVCFRISPTGNFVGGCYSNNQEASYLRTDSKNQVFNDYNIKLELRSVDDPEVYYYQNDGFGTVVVEEQKIGWNINIFGNLIYLGVLAILIIIGIGFGAFFAFKDSILKKKRNLKSNKKPVKDLEIKTLKEEKVQSKDIDVKSIFTPPETETCV